MNEPPADSANPPGAPQRINSVTSQTRRPGAGRGIAAGLLAGLAGLAIGYLVGGIVAPASGPMAAVGEASIGLTPPPVKNFAISAFGTHDKTALLIGIFVIFVIYASVVGVLAVRRLGYGMTGLALFVAIGLLAALTRPTATAAWALPTLVGGAAAALALRVLARAAAASPAGQAPGLESGSEPAQLSPDNAAPSATPAPAAEPADSPWEAPADWPPLPETLPVRARRPGSPAAGEPRRSFLIKGTTVAGVAAAAYLGGRLITERTSVSEAQASLRIPRPAHPAPPLPAGSDLQIPGLSSFITPNASFYRVDTAIVLPQIPPANWQLRIHGMVDREITLSFDDLIHRPLIADYITLTCVSNTVGGPYVGNALWVGASVASLLRQAGVQASANELLCTSSDGFTSGVPLQTVMDGRDALLAVAMNGTALPVAHGFPVRMVVPGLYGYVSACKWITDIEVTTFAASFAYWATLGWAQQAPIKTESRIDVPSGNGPVKAGPTAVAGVAWAQHKGIAAVEVQVDNGPWQEARLAAVPDIDCWRQWVWEWDATPGSHQIQARATDVTGYTQTSLQEPPEPNGASGYPSVTVNVNSA